ncbi:MAG: lysophospholipid acyltransferase family protein [Bdellovibrionales bacterium]
MFRQFFLPPLLFVVYFLWTRSWRVTVVESEGLKKLLREKRSAVYAFWHGDELAVIPLSRFYKVATMTSTSRDGELLDRVVRWLGVKTSRGSSTRGGVTALKGLLRHSQNGYNPCVAVDGPKGPYHKAKPGVFQISKVLEAPIVPLAIAASHKHIFEKSWNKAQLPFPFSKVAVVWGEPLPMVTSEDPRDPELATRLESALAAAGHAARKLIAPPDAQC